MPPAPRRQTRKRAATPVMLLLSNVQRRVGNGLVKHIAPVAGAARCHLRFDVCHWLQRREAHVIDAVAIAKIFSTLMGCWALGYGVGNAFAWVMKIKDVS